MNRAEKRRQQKLVQKAARKAHAVVPASPSPKQQTPEIQQAIDLALQHHSAGRLSEAESLYQQILQADPNQPDAIHYLGVIAHQVGKNDIAVDLITKALAISPDYAEAHNNLGLTLQNMGRLDEAVSSYHNALAINPDYAEAYYNQGNAFRDLGRQSEAVASYNKSIAIKPDYAEAYNNSGSVLQELRKLDEALTRYHKALAIMPNFAQAHNNMGSVLQEMGRHDEAVTSYHKALEIIPDYDQACFNLGNTFKELGQTDEAVASYHKAIEIKPDYVEAYSNLGNTLSDSGKQDEAVACYHKALEIKPDYFIALCNLGNVSRDQGAHDEAMAYYQKALAINPDCAEAYCYMGELHLKLEKMNEAIASYRRALAIRPDYAEAHNNLGYALLQISKLNESVTNFQQALAIRPDYAATHSNLIFLQDFFPDIDQVNQQKERERWNNSFILPLHKNIAPHSNDKNPERLLRIGYVSADFRSHSAQTGFGPLIIDHDHNNFEVICYDATINSDIVSAALRDAATHWRYIKNMSDAELANTMRNDAIDILVDLSAHTHGNRLKVFGYKPAPLQLSGIGHMAPGVSTIDYRLTTVQITPPGEESIYPEKPIYLDTYFGFTPPPEELPVMQAPCLQNEFITFGFLGRFSKISDEAFALWAKILQATPDSRLLLKYKELDDPDTREETIEMFSDLGISEDRLTLLGKTNQREHLEAHNRVDIVLDSVPHGGGITTMESLWMGVPVIGQLDPNKASGRLIDCIAPPVGLQDWVAHSADEYCAIATRWAGRTEELAQIRQQLRQRVCDVYFKFPQDVEKSYRLIWQRWCAGEKPAPLYPVSSQALS